MTFIRVRFDGYKWWQFWNWRKMWAARKVKLAYARTADQALHDDTPTLCSAVRGLSCNGDSAAETAEPRIGEGEFIHTRQEAFVGNARCDGYNDDVGSVVAALPPDLELRDHITGQYLDREHVAEQVSPNPDDDASES